MLCLPRFGHFRAWKMAAEPAPPSGRSWIFSSETATAFLSTFEKVPGVGGTGKFLKEGPTHQDIVMQLYV